MSSDANEKGARNEREAVHILERVYGMRNADRIDCGYGHDPLGFIDVLAAKEGYATRFVQVKTNRLTKKDRNRYASIVLRMPKDVQIEIWVRVDNEGWQLYEYDHETDEWVAFIEMDTCGEKATAEALREHVGFYDEVDR